MVLVVRCVLGGGRGPWCRRDSLTFVPFCGCEVLSCLFWSSFCFVLGLCVAVPFFFVLFVCDCFGLDCAPAVVWLYTVCLVSVVL